jgi:hypothetical protein
MNITYTKAIKNGKLKATEMEVGASVTGTIKGFKDGKFGQSILLDVNGRETEVYPAGNLKYAVADGKLQTGLFTTITREENGTTKNGYSVSRFNISQGQQQATQSISTAPKSSVQDQLAAIRSGNKVN